MTTPTTEELLTSINNSVTELQNAAASVAAAAHFHETANTMVADAVEQIEEARDIAMDEVAQEAHGFPIGTIADVPRKEYGNIFMDCDGSVLRKEDYGLLADVLGDIPDRLDGFNLSSLAYTSEVPGTLSAVNYKDGCAFSISSSGIFYSENFKDFYSYAFASGTGSYSNIIALFKKYVVLGYATTSGATKSIDLFSLNDDKSVTRTVLFAGGSSAYFVCNIIDGIFYAAHHTSGTNACWDIVSINLTTNAKNTYTIPNATDNSAYIISNFVKCNNRILFRTKKSLVFSDNNGVTWNLWEYNNVGSPLVSEDTIQIGTYLMGSVNTNYYGCIAENYYFCRTENNVLFENNATYSQFLYSTDSGSTWNSATKPWSASGSFFYVYYKNGNYYFIATPGNITSQGTVCVYKTSDFITWENIKTVTVNGNNLYYLRAFEKNGIVYIYEASSEMITKFYMLLNINNSKIFDNADLVSYFTGYSINKNAISYSPNSNYFVFSTSSPMYFSSFLKIDPITFEVKNLFDNAGYKDGSNYISSILFPDGYDYFYAWKNTYVYKCQLYSYDKDTEIKLPTVFSRSYTHKIAVIGGEPFNVSGSIPLPPSNPLTGKYAAIRVR